MRKAKLVPPIELIEGAPARPVRLTSAEYQALRTLGIADVALTEQPEVYAVSAGRKIGAVSIGGREIIVHPKITDLNRLVFLLGYSGGRNIWRDDIVRLSPDTELLPVLAEAFTRLASRATEQGLLQGYHTVTDSLPVLRGRVLAGEQMTRHYGFPVPLAVEYDDFSADISENRLLLSAVLRCLSIPRISPDVRRRLHRLRIALADVTPMRRGIPLPTWQPTRLNSRYHDALRLAEVVLSARSFEHRAGSLTVTGFMFDMWRVFEDFVCTALGEALEGRSGRYATQYRTHLDTDREVPMRPDLVWMDTEGRPRAVIDAKYKAERPDGFPDADLYQMLAYCTVLGLNEGHLVYAKGNEYGRTHHVRRAETTIHCHTLELASEPASLITQVETLAAAISVRAQETTNDSAPGS